MKEEETLLPYTVEELLERAEEGRRQIALGNYTEVEDFLCELFLQMPQCPTEVSS